MIIAVVCSWSTPVNDRISVRYHMIPHCSRTGWSAAVIWLSELPSPLQETSPRSSSDKVEKIADDLHMFPCFWSFIHPSVKVGGSEMALVAQIMTLFPRTPGSSFRISNIAVTMSKLPDRFRVRVGPWVHQRVVQLKLYNTNPPSKVL